MSECFSNPKPPMIFAPDCKNWHIQMSMNLNYKPVAKSQKKNCEIFNHIARIQLTTTDNLSTQAKFEANLINFPTISQKKFYFDFL